MYMYAHTSYVYKWLIASSIFIYYTSWLTVNYYYSLQIIIIHCQPAGITKDTYMYMYIELAMIFLVKNLSILNGLLLCADLSIL